MKKLSVKDLAFGGIACGAAILFLIGLAFSGGFSYFFSDWMAMVLSVLNIIALLIAVVFLVLSIVNFCTGRVSSSLSLITVIICAAVGFLRFILNTLLPSVRHGWFYFSTLPFIAFLLILLPLIAYFVCKSYLKEEAKDSVTVEPIGFPITEPAEGEAKSEGIKMSQSHIDACIMVVKDCIASDKLLYLRNMLENTDESCYSKISSLSMKKPVTVLLFSIFLGGWGVDRFYIGDVGIGVAKLLLGWLTFGIWWLVDIFLCNKKIKEKNLEQILNCIKQ